MSAETARYRCCIVAERAVSVPLLLPILVKLKEK
jgi:hypothetical protein